MALFTAPASSRSVVRAAAAAVVLGVTGSASAQLRIVNYNLIDKPVTTSDAHIPVVFSAIASDSINGIDRRPDIIALQEQSYATPANLASMLNSTYGVSTYAYAVPTQNVVDKMAFVYNSATLSLSSAAAVPVAGWRAMVRGEFQLVGYTGTESKLVVYSMHLMSQEPTGRADQTATVRSAAATYAPGTPIIYAGDFNIQRSTEESYQNLIGGATDNARGLDPIDLPGTWRDNAAVARWHTQSTRVNTEVGDGGATGGADDRFDFQIVNSTLRDGEGLSYIGPTTGAFTSATHSYRTFGNNGTTFNKAINDPDNTAEAANVLEALYRASDHLPVIADYQIPGRLAASAGVSASRVIQGAGLTTALSVSNTAPVAVSIGADELEYDITLSNGATGAASGIARALTASATHSFALDTTTLGQRGFTATISSASQGAQNPALTLTPSYTVLRHAQPRFLETETANQTIDFGIVAQDAPPLPVASVDIGNAPVLLPNVESAKLDLDSVTVLGDSSSFSMNIVPESGISAGDFRTFTAQLLGGGLGLRQAVFRISTSDEDLPGAATTAVLALTLKGRVAIGGDATLDNVVNFNDLLTLAKHYGQSSQTWQTGDFDRDGMVSFTDLLMLARNYGRVGSAADTFAAPWATAQSAVPEPSAAMGLIAATICLRRRSRCPVAQSL